VTHGRTCVIFYEGIRTNGLGTIKISTKLSNALHGMERDYCLVHLKYTTAPEAFFSTVSSPLYLFLVALGSCGVGLRVRSTPIGTLSITKRLPINIQGLICRRTPMRF
jgi:hypothetical protein